MTSVPPLNVLIIGSGGREHALLHACQASPLVASIAVAPGNGGMATETTCHPLNVEDVPATVTLAQKLGTNFVIVGPEVPLALGVVDALEAAGIPAYGPRKDAAQLEASKTFTKDFLLRKKIPTAAGEKFTAAQPAIDYLQTRSFPIVIKASGLAAGKGVVIASSLAEAEQTVRDMLENRRFGSSSEEILIEDFMDGEEASIMLMVSGTDYLMLPPSQDHKRIGDNDTGPNTGGMGAYAPASVVTPAIEQRVIQEIVEPTLQGLAADGITYRGTLYIGIMVTRDGPKVVEFNVRFGDPECQILLPLLATDPVALMYACAQGKPLPKDIRFHSGSAAIVVLTAAGYPGEIRKNDRISLPATLPENSQILHSGTRRAEDGQLYTSGGRVIGAVARGPSLATALQRAYQLAEEIQFAGRHFRRDIGARQLQRDAQSPH